MKIFRILALGLASSYIHLLFPNPRTAQSFMGLIVFAPTFIVFTSIAFIALTHLFSPQPVLIAEPINDRPEESNGSESFSEDDFSETSDEDPFDYTSSDDSEDKPKSNHVDEKAKREEDECNICKENKKCFMFEPCMHVVACGRCIELIDNRCCPLCRRHSKRVKKIFY